MATSYTAQVYKTHKSNHITKNKDRVWYLTAELERKVDHRRLLPAHGAI
ncbi:MAG: hypothetical protein GX604_04230 [Actinobacteria bacterium]|nr:hypothetical protein [Actinomycetota bacterium]